MLAPKTLGEYQQGTTYIRKLSSEAAQAARQLDGIWDLREMAGLPKSAETETGMIAYSSDEIYCAHCGIIGNDPDYPVSDCVCRPGENDIDNPLPLWGPDRAAAEETHPCVICGNLHNYPGTVCDDCLDNGEYLS